MFQLLSVTPFIIRWIGLQDRNETLLLILLYWFGETGVISVDFNHSKYYARKLDGSLDIPISISAFAPIIIYHNFIPLAMGQSPFSAPNFAHRKDLLLQTNLYSFRSITLKAWHICMFHIGWSPTWISYIKSRSNEYDFTNGGPARHSWIASIKCKWLIFWILEAFQWLNAENLKILQTESWSNES